MGKHIYGVVVKETEDGKYFAEAPNVDGCNAKGDTLFEAVENVSNSLEVCLSEFKDQGLEFPVPCVVEQTEGEVVYMCIDIEDIHLSAPTMTAAEAARELGVTKGRVSQLISSGKLVGERLAEGTNVTVASVEAYKASPRRAGRPKKEKP